MEGAIYWNGDNKKPPLKPILLSVSKKSIIFFLPQISKELKIEHAGNLFNVAKFILFRLLNTQKGSVESVRRRKKISPFSKQLFFSIESQINALFGMLSSSNERAK